MPNSSFIEQIEDFLSYIASALMTLDEKQRRFLEEKVKGIFPIEMAAGSPVANYFYNYWYNWTTGLSSVPIQQMGIRQSLLRNGRAAAFGIAGLTIGGVAAPGLRLAKQLQGLKSITTAEANRLQVDSLGQCETHHSLLAKKLFFIGGACPVEALSPILRTTGQFLEDAAPAHSLQMLPRNATSLALVDAPVSDGLAVVRSMSPSDAMKSPCRSIILEGDHASFSSDDIISNAPYWVRATLMGAILQAAAL